MEVSMIIEKKKISDLKPAPYKPHRIIKKINTSPDLNWAFLCSKINFRFFFVFFSFLFCQFKKSLEICNIKTEQITI